jgi:signal transduction histidine kinase
MSNIVPMQPGEKILLSFRKHWFLLFLQLFGVFIITILPFVGYAYFVHIGIVPQQLRAVHLPEFAAAFWLIIIWWTLAGIWTDYFLDIWLVTNRRVVSVEQKGLFDREVTTWGIERILEANVRISNFIETFFDYGTLEIHTAGEDEEHQKVYGVPDPEHVREVIMAEASQIGSLEEANQNQKELLHTISHEVKSYLSKDAASLAYIADGSASDPAKMRSFAQTALTETRKGVSALVSLLQGSNHSSGTMHLVHKDFDLKPLVLELSEAFKPVAERKGLKLSYTIEDGAYMIRGDEIKVRDLVIRNLIDNAIRYTPTGSISVHLSHEGTMSRLSVTDTGIGITRDDMPRLFKQGGKGENSSQVNPDSTGYGLASAKQIVEVLGGTAQAKSDGPGKGSTFIVTLPLAG